MAKKAKARKKAPARQGKKVQPIPAGYHAVTAYLSIKGAAQAIDFYQRAFGAKETVRIPGPEGTIGHAELQIGDSIVMLADESPGMGFLGPRSRGGTTIQLHLYVRDVDATVEKAVAAGGKLTRPLEDKFYGDRAGTLEDPYGHVWYIATHKEDVPPKEMKRRMDEMMKKSAAGG
jgi:PhnB protein